MELTDRVAIVTGGGSGIGRGIALELAKSGADVVIADVAEDAANLVAGEVEELGRKSLVTITDVGDRASTDDMADRAISILGRVDILVNNAGVAGAPGYWERDEATLLDWEATFKVNVIGIVNSTDAVQEHMKKRQSGKIVNIASIAGRKGGGRMNAHYGASKGAAINVSQSYALQLAPFNINVNSICPGLLWTELSEKILERRRLWNPDEAHMAPREIFDQWVEDATPLGRLQTPEDIGMLTSFLCSERARNITGQSINVDGGIVMN